MTEISTFKDEVYDAYELYHIAQAGVAGTNVKVVGKKPHADVEIATGHKLHRTRVYVNGVREVITEVATNVNDTDITITSTLTSSDIVDVFLAATTGTLQNNALLGKIPVTCDQLAQNYSAESNEAEIGSCGTERTETVRYSDDGEGTLMFKRQGNVNMQNFILARKNKKYLMFIVRDTTDAANTTYDILHECRISTYARGTKAGQNKQAMILDTFEFTFVPPVKVTT